MISVLPLMPKTHSHHGWIICEGKEEEEEEEEVEKEEGGRGESAKAESFRISTNLLCPRWDPENNTELEVSSGSRFGKILFEVRSVCAERERVSREDPRKPGNPQSR